MSQKDKEKTTESKYVNIYSALNFLFKKSDRIKYKSDAIEIYIILFLPQILHLSFDIPQFIPLLLH